MEVRIKPGKYVVAVSGGVDSMVLLDLLTSQPGLDLIIAQFDHGIRPDSALDTSLVKRAAESRQLKFETSRAELGPAASEAAARAARYEFLFGLAKKYEADAVVTAHHQDDLIETAILNILRGTGPAGLTAMASNRLVSRPMLHLTKDEIITYAKDRHLLWREDETNRDERYLRNYVRKNLIVKMSADERSSLLENIEHILSNQAEMAGLIKQIANRVVNGNAVNRQEFIQLPSDVGRNLLREFLKDFGVAELDRRTLERLDILIRTGRPGSIHNIKKTNRLFLTDSVAIITE